MEVLYNQFYNLQRIRESMKNPGGYLWYLQNFDSFHEIPLNIKEKEYRKYRRYLDNVMAYLTDFFKRSQPLTDFSIVEKQINDDFNYKWKEGTVRGWESVDLIQDSQGNMYYCEPCNKNFVNENTGKKHIKNQEAFEKMKANMTKEEAIEKGQQLVSVSNPQPIGDPNNDSFKMDQKKELAYKEMYIMSMKNLLCDIIQDTMNQIRKKKTRTIEESLAEENYQEAEVEEESDSDDEEPKYNPKNLPLGWDGKPIPYWLYKLHGLSIEYKCEICGNYSYWGRRAFERHFQEWRHAYGMKCLRIPNTVHFKEITSINDALVLHKKLLLETEASQFNPEVEEEYEDDEGNILKKKTYNDMRRQGLLKEDK